MQKSRQKKRVIIKALFIIFLGLILCIAYFFSKYQYAISTPVNQNNSEEISFSIKKGETTSIIAENLLQKGLILDENSFKWYTKLNNFEGKIKSGRFMLNQSMTIPEILAVISSNQQKPILLTIPEGATVEDIDRKLTDAGSIREGEFAQAVKKFTAYQKYSFINEEKTKNLPYPLEGYLFPDSYSINTTDFSSDLLISMMLNNFQKKLTTLDLEQSNYKLDQIINVASMIEKEAKEDQDRPLISDIIWKRLKLNWQLGIDATLLYLEKNRKIDYKDLQKDTDYNTRIKKGLPPGPICNPGLASIKAAAFPEQNDYFYYLTSSKDGKMIYSQTLEEHNQNKRKYL